MLRRIITLLILSIMLLGAEEAIDKKFFNKIETIRKEYRADLSKLVTTADRVELSIVKFDDVQKDPFDDEGTVFVSRFVGRAKILKKVTVEGKQRVLILNAFSSRLISDKDEGQADCHYPIHGLKIWKGEQLLFESTFCWKCNNFTFRYPEGSECMSASKEMKKVFNSLLVIPQKEIERFNKKYPKSK